MASTRWQWTPARQRTPPAHPHSQRSAVSAVSTFAVTSVTLSRVETVSVYLLCNRHSSLRPGQRGRDAPLLRRCPAHRPFGPSQCALCHFDCHFVWLVNKFATLRHSRGWQFGSDSSVRSSFISAVLPLDILDAYRRSFMGKKVNVWNKCVTFMSNVGSEQTFENLVDNFGSTEKKAWLLKSLNALVLSIIILYWIYFLLKYVVFKTFFDSIM